MDIMIIIFAIIVILGLGQAISKPISGLDNFDLSINQRTYQRKVEEYLYKRSGIEVSPKFFIHLIKNELQKKQHANPEVQGFDRVCRKPKTKKTYIDNGYLRFIDSKKYVHKWVMEKNLKRRLEAGEVVHHRDGNKLNNNIENLMLFPSQAAHDAYHRECKRRFGTWYAFLPDYDYMKF